MSTALFRYLASTLEAKDNCHRSNNEEWLARHTERARYAVKAHMPSGSGFDNGTTLDVDASSGEKIVMHTSFHHMNDSGCYDGWTEHTVTVRPSLAHGFKLHVSGVNRRDIKEYIYECFDAALRSDIDEAMMGRAS